MARNPVTRIIITAKDEASAVFGGLKTKAAAVATAIAGYFGVRMFGDALGSAREFESAMSRVAAASGATGAELASLRRAADEAGTNTRYTATEAANALETLAKSGLNASSAVEALPAVLNLAQAGGVGLAEASEFVTKAVNGMGLSFAEAGRVADVLSAGANASNTSVQGLAGALSYAAPVANALGLSLEDTVGIIGKFADAGIDASRAGTALNSILSQFANPASKFRQELAAAGITTSDFNTALRQLAAAGPEGQRAVLAVGQEAGPALRALLNQGMGALDELTAKLQDAAGSAQATAAVMNNNLDGAMTGLGSAWDALRRAFVEPLLQPITEQVNRLAGGLRNFVTGGTAKAFGDALVSAFQAAAKWAEEFVGKIDFDAVAARLSTLASEVGAFFARLGEQATDAGNRVQLAYGVMSAGINTVLAAVYKLGQGMSWLTSAFLADLALITQGLAKITFGDVSAGFAQAAASMREQAQAAYSVFEAFGAKADAAFDAAVAGADRAQTAWGALQGTTQAAAEQTVAALGQVGQAAGLTADQLDALGEGAQVMGGKVVDAATKAAGAAGEVDKLGAAAGRAATGVANVKASAEEVAVAFQRLGVTSTAELKRLADNARRDFETIRDSGVASKNDIQAAFVAYAKQAIEANGGVVASSLQLTARLHGVQLGADEMGRAVVSAAVSGAAAMQSLGAEAEEVAERIGMIERAATGLSDAMDGVSGAAAQASGRGGPARLMDSGEYALLGRAERLGGLALRKEIEDQLRQIGRATSPAGIGLAGISERYIQRVQDTVVARLDALQIEQESASNRYQSNEPRVTSRQPKEQVTTYRVEIGRGAGRSTAINAASQQDADALVELLRQLEADKSRA